MKFLYLRFSQVVTSAMRPRAWSAARRLLTSLLTVVAAVTLAGCSVAPKVEDVKTLPPAVEPMGEYLGRAQALEATEGGREQARQIYRAAAKTYPADKRPWLRLAQSYFDARDYGNAVLAAEEVVQRDTADITAQSLLAVSGLRISTAALSTLRNPSHMNSSTRQEAEGMAQNLRSILGEPVLVPRSAESDAEKAARAKQVVKPRAKPRVVPSPTALSPSVVAPKSAAPASPFGALN